MNLQQSTLMRHVRGLSAQHLIQTPTECLCPLSVMPNESDTSVEVCLSELASCSTKASAATHGLSRICILLEILEHEQQYLEVLVFPSLSAICPISTVVL